MFKHDLDFALFYARLEDLLEMKDNAAKTINPLIGEYLYAGDQDDFKELGVQRASSLYI